MTAEPAFPDAQAMAHAIAEAIEARKGETCPQCGGDADGNWHRRNTSPEDPWGVVVARCRSGHHWEYRTVLDDVREIIGPYLSETSG